MPQPVVPILLEHVSFDYQAKGADSILRDICLEIPQGACVAIVGSSGSGKTTLLRLLLGLYRPRTGRVILGGHELSEWDLPALRQRIGVVFQESVILSGTILENIALGARCADQDRAEAAARLAEAHDFILKFPGRYDAVVAERGLTLSAGERQRLSLARVFYREPELVILDEATSHLDWETEARVLKNLGAFLRGRTSVVVTHGLAALELADRVFQLEHGQLVPMAAATARTHVDGDWHLRLKLQSLS